MRFNPHTCRSYDTSSKKKFFFLFFCRAFCLGQSVGHIDPRPLVQLAATSTYSTFILAALATGYLIHHTNFTGERDSY